MAQHPKQDLSFLSLIVWAYILGPIGAILAIPASLLFKALLVDMVADAQRLGVSCDKPVCKERTTKRKSPPVEHGHTDQGAETAPPAGTH